MNSKKVLLVVLALLFICGLFGSDAVAQKGKPAKDSKATEERDQVETLIKQLKNKDKDVRISAISSLAKTKDPRGVEPLISVLKDQDSGVRWRAAWALGVMKDPRTVEPLIALLKDKDPKVREKVVEALKEIGDPRATEPLIALMKDMRAMKEMEGKWIVYDAIAQIKNPKTVKLLVDALKDKDPNFRKDILYILSIIKDPAALEPIITALKDKAPEVRRQATWSLGLIKDPRAVEPLILALKDQDDGVKGYAAEALGERKDPRAVKPLIALLRDENPWLIEKAIKAIREIKDPSAVEPLIALLKDKDYKVRKKAIMALGDIQDPRVVEPLIALLKDEYPEVREKAIEVIRVIKDPRVVEPLIALLKDEDYEVRKKAIMALGNIQDPRAIETLIVLLKDENYELRKEAIEAIIEIKDPRVVEPLIALLKDEDHEVQEKAIEALGNIQDPRAIEPLIAELSNKERIIRNKAVSALAQIKDPRVIEYLIKALKDDNLYARIGALRVIGLHKDPRAVPALVTALGDAEPTIRNRAVTLLSEIDPTWAKREKVKRKVSEFISALNDNDLTVQDIAVKTLIAINDPQAIEPLIRAFKNDYNLFRCNIGLTKDILVNTKDPRLIDLFTTALQDEDSNVRRESAHGLSKIKDPRATEALLSALKDKEKSVREGAEKALIEINPKWAETDVAKRKASEFISALSDKDPVAREGAAFALGETRDPRAVEPLIKALLGDDYSGVRKYAATALGKIKDPRATEALLSALKDKEKSVREGAEEALIEINPKWAETDVANRKVAEFITALSDKDPEVRKGAVYDLGNRKDPRAVEPLIKALLEDKDPVVREYAATALGKIKDPRATEALLSALKDKHERVREMAERALIEINPKWAETDVAKRKVAEFISSLSDKDPDVRIGAAFFLGRIRDPRAVEPLIKALLGDDYSGVREYAAIALGWIKDTRSIEALISALKDKVWSVREGAEKALIEINPKWMETDVAKRRVAEFITALSDKDPEVRKGAVYDLGNRKDSRAVEPLIKALLQDSDPSVRQGAATALGKIKDPRATEALISALKDKVWSVRERAEEALIEINPKWAETDVAKRKASEFITALNDKDPVVREYAATALGKIKDTRAIEALISALKDKNLSVRDEAEKALMEINPKWAETDVAKRKVPEFISAMSDKDSGVRIGAVYAIGKIKDPRAVDHLIKALNDAHWEVRMEAIYALGEIKNPHAIGFLINSLKDNDRDVRIVASETLRKIDPKWMETDVAKKKVPEFITALSDRDPSVRKGVAYALGEIKDHRAIEPLINALKNRETGVNYQIVKALYKIDPKWTEKKSAGNKISELIHALKDSDVEIRNGAAETLGYIKDPRALKPLYIALKVEDKDKHVKKAARAIAEIKRANCQYSGAVIEKDIKEAIAGYFFTGRMGKKITFQVNLYLDNNKSPKGDIALSGKYRYDRHGSSLDLYGSMKRDSSFELDERTEMEDGNSRETGRFEGKFSKDFRVATGKWTSADGKRSYDFTLNRQAVYRTFTKSVTRLIDPVEIELKEPELEEPESEEREVNFDEDREVYFEGFTYTYPVFDSPKLAEINKKLAEVNKKLRLDAEETNTIKIQILSYTPQLVNLSDSIYAAKTEDSKFEEITFAELVGNDCLTLLDRLIYDKLISKDQGPVDEEKYPNGRGLAKDYFDAIYQTGISFSIPEAVAYSIHDRASGYGYLRYEAVFIPYKSFSKCIPKNSPLRSVMR